MAFPYEIEPPYFGPFPFPQPPNMIGGPYPPPYSGAARRRRYLVDRMAGY